MNDATEQQHPIGIFLKVWLLLFVLSIFSYMVDYFQLQGYWRWSLILIFMVLKAALIMSVFMHFMWERFALQFILLTPLFAIAIFVVMMAWESDYINWARLTYFSFESGG